MTVPPPVLEIERLTKTYRLGAESLTVLHGVSFALQAGETCSIIGPSGSGKSTLLGLAAGLDAPSSGTVRVDGEDLARLGEEGRAALRNRAVGFVFQSFHLIPTLTALENITVPLELRGEHGVADRAHELLVAVGLTERANHYPKQLSGGEQQRIALARAFINRPRILFADEPTGNLDADTGTRIEALLFDLNARFGTTLVLVTHDPDLAARTGRVIRLAAGRVVSDIRTGVASPVAATPAVHAP